MSVGAKWCRRHGKWGYRSAGEAAVALRLLHGKKTALPARQYEKVEISYYKGAGCPRWHLTSAEQVQHPERNIYPPWDVRSRTSEQG